MSLERRDEVVLNSFRLDHTHYTHALSWKKSHQEHTKNAAIQLQSNTLSQ